MSFKIQPFNSASLTTSAQIATCGRSCHVRQLQTFPIITESPGILQPKTFSCSLISLTSSSAIVAPVLSTLAIPASWVFPKHRRQVPTMGLCFSLSKSLLKCQLLAETSPDHPSICNQASILLTLLHSFLLQKSFKILCNLPFKIMFFSSYSGSFTM